MKNFVVVGNGLEETRVTLIGSVTIFQQLVAYDGVP